MTVFKENSTHFIGPIVPKPFQVTGPDAQILIETGVFIPNDPPGVHQIHNLAHYNGVLLSVHFTKENWNTVEGSAVMVAPGIAITAAHVDEDYIPYIMTVGLEIFCTGLTHSGMRHWRVKQITKANGTDLMVLSLEYRSPMPADARFAQARMTTRLPAIGEPIMVVGFRASDEDVPVSAEDGMYFPVEDGHLKYGVKVLIGIGEVTQHSLNGRGSALPAPVIEVACSTSGGMSGGPAFDQNGMLVGILSYSLDAPDGRGPSQISLLSPALVTTITPAFLSPPVPETVRLLDLDPRLCGIDRRDVIRSTTDRETGAIRLEWDTW